MSKQPRKTKAQKLEEKRERQAAEKKAKEAAEAKRTPVSEESLAELEKQFASCEHALAAKRTEIKSFVKLHTNQALDDEAPGFSSRMSNPFLGTNSFALNDKLRVLRTQRDALKLKEVKLRKQVKAARENTKAAQAKRVEEMLNEFAARSAEANAPVTAQAGGAT